MLSGERGDSRALGQTYGLYAGAFAVFLIVLAFLGQVGLPDRGIAFLVVMVTLVTYGVIGIVSRTLTESDFYVAGRAVPPVINGMATAAAFIAGAGFLGLAGAFFAQGSGALALLLGWVAGFALLAVLIAPYFRKSAAVTVPDFLAIRFGDRRLRLAGVVIVLVSSCGALAAAIATAGYIGSIFLGTRADIAIGTAVIVLLLSSLFGGMRAVTLVAGAQLIILVIGMLVPAMVLSARDYGLPVPQLTYGYALQDISPAEGAIVTLPGRFMPFGAFDWFTLGAIALSFAAGVASMPHILARSATARQAGGARRSLGWALLFVVTILLTAPAIAAFAKLAVVRDVVGAGLDELPDWIFGYGRAALVRICGVNALTLQALQAMCGPAVGTDGLAAGDIAISADMVTLGFADMAGLPYVMTALIAAGGLAATLATANALLVAIASTLGYDLYGKLMDERAQAGRRLIVTRLILIAVAATAGWFALHRADLSFTLAAASPGLAASGFFAALVLGIWWQRTTAPGALAGMVAGFAAAAIHVGMTLNGSGAQLGPLGIGDAGVPGYAAAIYGLPLGFLVTVAVSLMTKAPDAARLEIIDAIRRPRRDAILEDSGA